MKKLISIFILAILFTNVYPIGLPSPVTNKRSSKTIYVKNKTKNKTRQAKYLRETIFILVKIAYDFFRTGKYSMRGMLDEYYDIDDDYAESYFSNMQRTATRTTAWEGILKRNIPFRRMGTDSSLYAMRQTGQLCVMADHEALSHFAVKPPFHHSFFFMGGSVSVAGGMIIEEGKIKKVDNFSGHYRPERKRSLHIAFELLKDGFFAINQKIEFFISGKRFWITKMADTLVFSVIPYYLFVEEIYKIEIPASMLLNKNVVNAALSPTSKLFSQDLIKKYLQEIKEEYKKDDDKILPKSFDAINDMFNKYFLGSYLSKKQIGKMVYKVERIYDYIYGRLVLYNFDDKDLMYLADQLSMFQAKLIRKALFLPMVDEEITARIWINYIVKFSNYSEFDYVNRKDMAFAA